MEKAYKDNKIVEEMGYVTEISLKEKIKETEGRKCVILTKKKKRKLWKIILGKNGKIKERNKKKNETRMKIEREYNAIQFLFFAESVEKRKNVTNNVTRKSFIKLKKRWLLALISQSN